MVFEVKECNKVWVCVCKDHETEVVARVHFRMDNGAYLAKLRRCSKKIVMVAYCKVCGVTEECEWFDARFLK